MLSIGTGLGSWEGLAPLDGDTAPSFTNNFLRALSLRGEGLARRRWYFFTTLPLATQVKLLGVVVRCRGLAMTQRW